jgi:hypothetical protein
MIGGDIMLTKKEKHEICSYNEDVCDLVLCARKNSQRLPHDLYLKRRACQLEGRLIAIRHFADILEISLPNRDIGHDVIV